MKLIKLLYLVLSFVTTASYADMGACYVMKVDYKTKSGGSASGYIRIGGYDLYIERQNTTPYYQSGTTKKELILLQEKSNDVTMYPSDREFSKFVFSLINDTLVTQSDFIEIRYVDNNGKERHIPILIGAKTDIAKSEIVEFDVVSVASCTPGESIITKLLSKDKEWLTSENFVTFEGIGGMLYCGYSIYVYSEITAETQTKINELKELIQINDAQNENQEFYSKDDFKQNRLNINSKVQQLKDLKIVVIQSCAC